MRGDRGTGGTPPPAAPADPLGDPHRLAVIADLGFHGQDGDFHLEAILRTLAAACRVSIAALNIITPGRQTYAAELGLGAPCADLPDEFSFCATLVATGKPLVVTDATRHPVLRNSPVVRNGMVGAYAGEPVVHRGVVVGALGIFAPGARCFGDADLAVLHEQARLVELILAMRYGQDRTNAVMLRSLIDHSESLIYVTDLEGRYLLANPLVERLFGVSEAELLGRSVGDLEPERGAEWRRNDRRALEGTVHVEEFADLPDGRHVYETVKYPLTDAAGRVYAIGGVSLDVTAKQQVAQAVADARDAAMDASRQKSSFLATMSHEIRTPMNAVIGMTGLLLETALDDEQQEFVETVRSSGEALLTIINDILDFSKIDAGGLRLERRPFELLECVEGALELVAATPRAGDCELVLHVDDRCPRQVVGDPTRLSQLLVNLLRNAVKFTGAGEVLLTVEPVEPTGDDASGRLRFSVADTGIGIPADRVTSLFEPFRQVDASTTRLYGGTGLGLAISRRLVEAMGGTLSVDSVVGAGSTFSFAIALDAAARDPGLVSAEPLEPLQNRTVLLVDDNSTSRRVLRRLLEAWGMRVTEAVDGADATALVESGTAFDVALLDLGMPGMTGEDLARHLRAAPATSALPLVLLGAGNGRSRLAEPAVFSAVVPKPVRRGRLEESLRVALDAAPASPPAPAPAAGAVSPPDRARPPEQVPVAPPVQAGGTLPRAGALRVLLAEDNAVNQRLGRLMLTKLGHHVDVVANGREAADTVRRGSYDAVLMDIEMPILDGLQATRVIRSELRGRRQPQIVALTASALVEDRQACLAAGMDDHLAKPVRLRDLDAALIRAALRIEGQRAAPHGPAGFSNATPSGGSVPT